MDEAIGKEVPLDGKVAELPATSPFGAIKDVVLLKTLSARAIREKQIEAEDYLFINDHGGGHLSTIDFGQVFGATGTGKTLFSMALAVCVACGRDFMYWKCVRPRKVIYFDGELAETTIKERLALATTGLSAGERELLEDNLIVFNRDTAFNELGIELADLDSLLGRQQVEHLVDLVKADLAVFDSRFCLLAADMKEEGSMPKALILSMRRRRCLSLWLHHSGKDTTRGGYGDKSAEFLMDFNIELALTDVESELGMTWRKKRKRNEKNGDLYADLTVQHREGSWYKRGEAPVATRKGATTVKNETLVMRAMTELNIAKQNATGQNTMHNIERERIRDWLLNNGLFEADGGVMGKSDREAVNKAIRNLINNGELQGDAETLTIAGRK
jgi:hypothetical protein